MKRLLMTAAMATLLSACSDSNQDPAQYGSAPVRPAPQRGLLPSMNIADPALWGDQRPIVPQGYTIAAIATDLKIPRQTLMLPNGDILVAEGRGGGAPALKPKDVIASRIKSKGNTAVESGNRLTLLRDTAGDGSYKERNVFAEDLNAPYGLALVDGKLYVANQDALVRFDYSDGQTRASGPPVKVTDLPSAINHHWTKALTASPDGQFLYVGIGSNSNITERGMEAEVDRAMVWQVDARTGAHKPYATGLRNPTALAIQPGTNQLWAVANERDELGPDLVPDYLTSVREGAFYGWPYSYWGQNVDPRVRPQNLRRSPQRLLRISAWDRMWLHSASAFQRPRWAPDSQRVYSSASMEAGIASTRWATRLSSYRSAMGAPPFRRSTSFPAFGAQMARHAAGRSG